MVSFISCNSWYRVYLKCLYHNNSTNLLAVLNECKNELPIVDSFVCHLGSFFNSFIWLSCNLLTHVPNYLGWKATRTVNNDVQVFVMELTCLEEHCVFFNKGEPSYLQRWGPGSIKTCICSKETNQTLAHLKAFWVISGSDRRLERGKLSASGNL